MYRLAHYCLCILLLWLNPGTITAQTEKNVVSPLVKDENNTTNNNSGSTNNSNSTFDGQNEYNAELKPTSANGDSTQITTETDSSVGEDEEDGGVSAVNIDVDGILVVDADLPQTSDGPSVVCLSTTMDNRNGPIYVAFQLPKSTVGTLVEYQAGRAYRQVENTCYILSWTDHSFQCDATGNYTLVLGDWETTNELPEDCVNSGGAIENGQQDHLYVSNTMATSCPARTVTVDNNPIHVRFTLPDNRGPLSNVLYGSGSAGRRIGDTCYNVEWTNLVFVCDRDSLTWALSSGSWTTREPQNCAEWEEGVPQLSNADQQFMNVLDTTTEQTACRAVDFQHKSGPIQVSFNLPGNQSLGSTIDFEMGQISSLHDGACYILLWTDHSFMCDPFSQKWVKKSGGVLTPEDDPQLTCDKSNNGGDVIVNGDQPYLQVTNFSQTDASTSTPTVTMQPSHNGTDRPATRPPSSPVPTSMVATGGNYVSPPSMAPYQVIKPLETNVPLPMSPSSIVPTVVFATPTPVGGAPRPGYATSNQTVAPTPASALTSSRGPTFIIVDQPANGTNSSSTATNAPISSAPTSMLIVYQSINGTNSSSTTTNASQTSMAPTATPSNLTMSPTATTGMTTAPSTPASNFSVPTMKPTTQLTNATSGDQSGSTVENATIAPVTQAKPTAAPAVTTGGISSPSTTVPSTVTNVTTNSSSSTNTKPANAPTQQSSNQTSLTPSTSNVAPTSPAPVTTTSTPPTASLITLTDSAPTPSPENSTVNVPTTTASNLPTIIGVATVVIGTNNAPQHAPTTSGPPTTITATPVSSPNLSGTTSTTSSPVSSPNGSSGTTQNPTTKAPKGTISTESMYSTPAQLPTYYPTQSPTAMLCGCAQCAQVWDALADAFTCGERIIYLVTSGTELEEACDLISVQDFPDVCGLCACKNLKPSISAGDASSNSTNFTQVPPETLVMTTDEDDEDLARATSAAWRPFLCHVLGVIPLLALLQ